MLLDVCISQRPYSEGCQMFIYHYAAIAKIVRCSYIIGSYKEGCQVFVYHNDPRRNVFRCWHVKHPYRKDVRCLYIIAPYNEGCQMFVFHNALQEGCWTLVYHNDPIGRLLDVSISKHLYRKDLRCLYIIATYNEGCQMFAYHNVVQEGCQMLVYNNTPIVEMIARCSYIATLLQ